MRNFGGSAYAVTGIPSNMGIVTEKPSPSRAGTLRCVLVHAGQGNPPARLQRALTAKQIQAEAVGDVFGALARLCVLAKDTSVALPILAIVEPERVEHAAALFEAASVYAPRAVLWVYSSEPHEQIREVRESDLASWRSVQSARAPGQTGEQVGGERRTESDRQAGTPSENPTGGVGADSGAILTEEELEMLLADDGIDGTIDRGNSDPNGETD